MAENIRVHTVIGETDALHWFLTDREIMWQSLKELSDFGDGATCRGTISIWPDAEGNQQYIFEVNDNKGNSATGWMGAHIVYISGISLTAYNQAQYETIKVGE